mmetsp:Transcript_16601/g.46422  ORF Transcript_16601/g.46422 Transcript_16601/m.46422 type:complete len:548 (+) Transcript_16601:334-1977(+)|eukprot:CAMPEP_0119560548 /NCGR_PEP_ID=MMETSP1352-20130426/15146_1 /TAXON_ID=265584 /ORGANISM="Stauroneis constricta, Strain CCMP1120" /LENGTH=547 /DNA_ID=CAMNT_0007608543 /DNA_START=323 /DNA_END=1966 /DNA_ORIENTATION=-
MKTMPSTTTTAALTLMLQSASLFLLCLPRTTLGATGEVVYEDCNITEYYAAYGLTGDPTTWNKKDIFLAIKNSHRNVVPSTNITDSGNGDVWDALQDIERASLDNTSMISMLYSDDTIEGLPFGTRFWVQEHIFPVQKGVGFSGPDYTDLHNIKTTSQLTREIRSTKFFGKCGVLVRDDTCNTPAEGGAEDTCECNRLFEPPASKRGDIARALMYMDIRYDGSDENTLDLRLTDCPFDRDRDMAYLSQMLTWHLEDEADDLEKFRNQRVCEGWQGNRNPFIDFPDLPQALYGLPKPLPAVGERLIYEECEDINTEPPTFSPNDCEALNPGDFGIFLFNSQDPDSVALFNFEEVERGFEIFLTDKAWDGTGFQETDLDTDGTLSFTVQDRFLSPGTFFGYGPDMNFTDLWKPQTGTFSLSEEGEQIHIYCEMANGKPKPLFSLTYTGSWTDPKVKSPPLGPNESYLPEGSEEFDLVLPQRANYQYIGPTENTTKEELKRNGTDPTNWQGSSVARYDVGEGDSAASMMSISFATVVVVMMSTMTTMLLQ